MKERILRLLRLALFSLCGMLALLTPSMAHAYPERTIRLVVPNAAGGGTDAFARVMAQKLGEALQQTVVVENKPGAQGGIGTTYGAKAAPDG